MQRALSLYAQAATPYESSPLSLKECIPLALERNFAILVEGYNPKICAADVINEQAECDSAPFAGFRYSGGREPLADLPRRWPPDRTTKIRIATPSAGLEQRLQLGKRLNLPLSQEHITSNETGSSARFVEPSGEIRTIFSSTQPILGNFGFDVTRARIRIDATDQEISESSLKDRVIRAVSRAQELYWGIIFRIQDLGVRRLSLKLAQDLLEAVS